MLLKGLWGRFSHKDDTMKLQLDLFLTDHKLVLVYINA